MGLVILVAVLPPNLRDRAKEAVRRAQCRENLKQISLALHNYQEAYGSLPPAYLVDTKGNRLHSWRTLILPYLDQKLLYEKIDLSKPWDDPANAQARSTPVTAYRCPSAGLGATRTTYLAFTGDDFCFAPTRGRTLDEITDGLSKTVMILESDTSHSVDWMSPYDERSQSFPLFSIKTPQEVHPGGTYVTLADGSVRFIRTGVSRGTRRALMTIAGGEQVREY
ncbi:DUF1559 domain-containing protein [Planctomicrobium piriforme]|uniref:DUF1559 domain-containing protein n=1 Tax=Planctomicrobium piriforme TaxID=1576369 RepID=UPI001587BB87|nr:DUF1559 domain-containing protein [Planctomicrobium piriforme]